MSAGGSSGSSDQKSRIDPKQKQFLTDLWYQAQNLNYLNTPGGAQEFTQGLVDQYLPGMQAGAGEFGNIASGQSAGQQQLAQNMTSESPWLQQQISNLGQDIGRNLGENILPQLRSGGVAAGAPGGSRSQIAAGLATQGAQQQFGQAATNLRAQDLMRQQQAAQLYTQNQLAGGQGAIQGGQALYNMGMNPYMAQWLPLQQYGALLGNPTVTSRGESDRISFGFGF